MVYSKTQQSMIACLFHFFEALNDAFDLQFAGLHV